MDVKKSAKAKAEPIASPPPPQPAKRMLRSASATVAPTVPTEDSALNAQKQLNKKALLAQTRALMDKQGFLKQEERITVSSLYEAFKLMHNRYNPKIPTEAQRSLLAFKVLLGVLVVEQNEAQDQGMVECAAIISTKVEEAIDKGLAKMSNAIESSLANQRELQKSSKKIEDSAAAIHKALEEVDKNLVVVSDSSNKLTNTMSSYKDALLTVPKPPQHPPAAGRPADANDPRIVRDQNRKACQVLVDIYNKDTVNRSLEELKNRFNTLIGEEPTEPLSDVNVQHIVKLRNGGLILQFETKEAADWFKQPDILASILPRIDSSAKLKSRAYQILVPRVPVIFETDSEDSLRELEEQNGMKDGILLKARWIKLTYRRALGQRYAHLALSVSTPGEANIIIRDGIYICGAKMYPRKLKMEPKQCMKCRKWGHFAAECLEEKDACGNCGEDHHTKDCPDKDRRYCVSCKNDTHASWDRNCPEFKCRVERMDENHPENALIYFPTDEDWTTQVCPTKIDFDAKFPAKYEVASLPLPANNERQLPTRQVANKKRGPRLVQYNNKGPLNNFITSTSSNPHKYKKRLTEEELFESLSDEEITRQLDEAFSEE